ncbi:hypothetical protein AOQ84DRAFT_358543 [Glonium stellatum]|uniref:D-serine dehydratase n=1 Tax=Glonium stellatum TaxID=574774 RepID=A0A8E2JZ61_9PEZI|nr:hypothetical protein AOQ84DRAFT_358543 [Glonium stellatum]
MDMHSIYQYPVPSAAALKLQYVGRKIQDIDPPAAIIDRAVVKKNCNVMLQASRSLSIGFRAHVKTHKTVELARLQVGEDGPAHFIVSTIIEAEQLLPYLLECQAQGRPTSMLYGMPLPPSKMKRLIQLAGKLKPWTLHVLLDHPETYDQFSKMFDTGIEEPYIGAFIKIDTGYHRSGLHPKSELLDQLITRICAAKNRCLSLAGLYSHLGNSYGGSSSADALMGLMAEIRGLKAVADIINQTSISSRLTLSVGATPTATAAQNIFDSPDASDATAKEIIPLIADIKKDYDLELHAGVYPLLDLQQLATHARPAEISKGLHAMDRPVDCLAPLSTANIGLRILVEVASIYDERDKPEALIAAGSLALGRDPCKSYLGWGIVTPWQGGVQSAQDISYPIYDEINKAGWIVGRISQEHGILVWEGEKSGMRELHVGEKLLLWPNHACIAGAGFSWYLVVDSDSGDADKIVDVWVRWRGW